MKQKVEKSPLYLAFMLIFLPKKWTYHSERNNLKVYKSLKKIISVN